MKRGQVTVFIIIAIILIAAGGFAYYTISKSKSNNEFFSRADIKPTLDSIKNSLIDCRDISIKESVENIGIQGGYYEKPAKVLDLNWTFIPYYFDGQIIAPDTNKIESELGNSVSYTFTKCVDNLDIKDFQISHQTAKTKTKISKGEILVTIDMPLTIKKDSNIIQIEMKDQPDTIKSPLYDILEVANYIVNSTKKDQDNICISCIEEMAKEKDLYVFAVPIDDSSILFIISGINANSESYYFEFLNKYSGKNINNFTMPDVPLAN